MNATLQGPNGLTSLDSSSSPCTIGRAPDNQIVVNDSKASAHHAQLRSYGHACEIIDLASSNGTFVNEQQISQHVPRQLSANDRIRIGDTTFVFETNLMPSQLGMEATVYAGGNQAGSSANPVNFPPIASSSPAYPVESYGMSQVQGAYSPPPYATSGYQGQPEVYSTPSYPINGYGAQQGIGGPNPPVQPKKSGRGKLWVIMGAVVAVLLIAAIVLGIVGYEGYVNRPTATRTLTAFCTALKGSDFHTAYNQLSTGLQAKYGSEAVFALAYASNDGLGKISNCSVSNVNDGANTGTISYVLTQGDASNLVVDYGLLNENSAVKINAQHPRSTPALTLNNYCSALAQQDYQTAYNQFSMTLQGQIGSESTFASLATANNIKGCTLNNVNNIAGTGTLTYLRTDGNKTSASVTLTNEQSTWKISELKTISSPTQTLLTYCDDLKSQDYQDAYAQLSSTAQSQETEAQFAANFSGTSISACKVSNVNDTAGTGSITYTLGDGSTGILDYTLVNESGTWKINSEKQHS